MYNILIVCRQITDIKLVVLYGNTWNHLTLFNQIIKLVELFVFALKKKKKSSGSFKNVIHKMSFCPVGWGCRIHTASLQRGKTPPPNECPGYDTKQSDGEVPPVLELWGMRTTP